MLYLYQKVYWRMNESLQMLNEPIKIMISFFLNTGICFFFHFFLHSSSSSPFPSSLLLSLSFFTSSSSSSSSSPSSLLLLPLLLSLSLSLSLSSSHHHHHLLSPHPHHVSVSAECRRGHRGEECAAAGEDEVVQTAQILCGHGEGGRTEADTADGWDHMDGRREGWMWAHGCCVVLC